MVFLHTISPNMHMFYFKTYILFYFHMIFFCLYLMCIFECILKKVTQKHYYILKYVLCANKAYKTTQ